MNTNDFYGESALHEAGHVLMALKERRRFDEVVFRVEGDTVNAAIENLNYRRFDDEIVRIALGGIVAVRFCLKSWDLGVLLRADNDLRTVTDFIRESNSPNPDYLLAWNVSRTVEVIRKRWGTLEALAHALLARERLSFDDAAAIVKKKPGADHLPPNPMGADDPAWTVLIEHIQWRVKCPGLEDAARELIDSINAQ